MADMAASIHQPHIDSTDLDEDHGPNQLIDKVENYCSSLEDEDGEIYEEILRPSSDPLMETSIALWAFHPHSSSFFVSDQQLKKIKAPSFNISTPSPAQNPSKDIGMATIPGPPSMPTSIQSVGQQLLHQVRDVIGENTVTESKLQFATQWLLD